MQILPVLLRLYSSSNSACISDALSNANASRIAIDQPHAVVYGTATPDALYDSYSEASITGGFLGRV